MHHITKGEYSVAAIIAIVIAAQYIIAVIAIAFLRARCWERRFKLTGRFHLCDGSKPMCGGCPYNPADYMNREE